MWPFRLVGLTVVYVALPLAGWYCLFRRLALVLYERRDRITGMANALRSRLVAAVVAGGVTTVWLLLSLGGPLGGLLFTLLMVAPLVALGWRLAGNSLRPSINWLRRFVAVGVIVMIPHLVLPADPGYADYYFHWLRYQRIVSDVRSDDLQRGNCRRYMMDSRFLFISLAGLPEERSPASESLDRTGEVQAFMTENGKLLVSVITVDYHHAGTFGYLYADDRTDLDHAEGCLRVLGNTTRTKLNSHWERFRWD